jgi:hypothetical protein
MVPNFTSRHCDQYSLNQTNTCSLIDNTFRLDAGYCPTPHKQNTNVYTTFSIAQQSSCSKVLLGTYSWHHFWHLQLAPFLLRRTPPPPYNTTPQTIVQASHTRGNPKSGRRGQLRGGDHMWSIAIKGTQWAPSKLLSTYGRGGGDREKLDCTVKGPSLPHTQT